MDKREFSAMPQAFTANWPGRFARNINAARDPLTGAVLGAELGCIHTTEGNTK